MSLAFVFPGQGSQSVGMMRALAERSPRIGSGPSPRRPKCWATICGRFAGDGPAEPLNATETHAAGDADGGRRRPIALWRDPRRRRRRR